MSPSVSMLKCPVLVCLIPLAGCSAPVTAEVLPMAEARTPAYFGFAHVPEAIKPIPPIASIELLATHPEHPRWAASDRRRVWVGEGEQLHELERDYATQVSAMAIDGDGLVWLIDSEDRLTRIDMDDRAEQLPALPIRRSYDLRAVGPRLVVLGQLGEGVELPPDEPADASTYFDPTLVLAVSRDHGHSWQLRRRPDDLSEFDDLSIAPDGSMQLMDGAEADCGGGFQSRWRSHLDRPGWTSLDWPLDTYSQRTVADHGWAYGVSDCDERIGYGLCAVDRKGNTYGLLNLDSSYLMLHDGVRTMLLANGAIWSVSGRRLTRVAAGGAKLIETGFDGAAITHDGDVMISAGTTIHIGSATGWTSLQLG